MAQRRVAKDLEISDTREVDGRGAQRARLVSDPQNTEAIVNGQ